MSGLYSASLAPLYISNVIFWKNSATVLLNHRKGVQECQKGTSALPCLEYSKAFFEVSSTWLRTELGEILNSVQYGMTMIFWFAVVSDYFLFPYFFLVNFSLLVYIIHVYLHHRHQD